MDFENMTEIESQTPAGKSPSGPAVLVDRKPAPEPRQSAPAPATTPAPGSIADFTPPPVPVTEPRPVQSSSVLDLPQFTLTVFATVLITGVLVGGGVYGILTYLGIGSASRNADPYARYQSLVTPTIPPVQADSGVASAGTEMAETDSKPPVASPGAVMAEDLPAEPLTGTWTLVFDTPGLALAGLNSPIATVSATLAGPARAGDTICYEQGGNTYQYFTAAAQGAPAARICDEPDASGTGMLTCVPYRAGGITIQEPLLPPTSCASPAARIRAGTYTLTTRIYTGCQISPASEGVFPSECRQSTEVVSGAFPVE